MEKIAVIQTAFPGDVILATPLFEALKDSYPQSKITAIVRPESYLLIKNNPFLDDIIIFDKYGKDKGLFGLFRVARKLSGFDWAIIVQRFFRSAILAAMAGISKRTGFDNTPFKFLYSGKIHYDKDKHEVHRCLDLIKIADKNKYRPRIYIDAESKEKADKILAEKNIGKDFAIIAPGSVWTTKRYSNYPALIELIKKELDLDTVLLGGKDDIAISGSIAKASKDISCDLTGKTDFLVSAEIISRAKIAITNDSAPAHIAAAIDTPVVAVFGPTTPQFGFAPYSENSSVVDIGPLYCRPCTAHGSDQCPQEHFKCMLDIQPDKIINAAKLLLE